MRFGSLRNHDDCSIMNLSCFYRLIGSLVAPSRILIASSEKRAGIQANSPREDSVQSNEAIEDHAPDPVPLDQRHSRAPMAWNSMVSFIGSSALLGFCAAACRHEMNVWNS